MRRSSRGEGGVPAWLTFGQARGDTARCWRRSAPPRRQARQVGVHDQVERVFVVLGVVDDVTDVVEHRRGFENNRSRSLNAPESGGSVRLAWSNRLKARRATCSSALSYEQARAKRRTDLHDRLGRPAFADGPVTDTETLSHHREHHAVTDAALVREGSSRRIA